jgi:thiamine-phosphate pyrophosphorylase
MILPTLQYITHPQEDFTNFSWLHRLGENGVKWVQLRIKESDFEKRFPKEHYKVRFLEIAEQMKVICDHFNMILTLNDHTELLTFSGVSGIHVGMEDENPSKIREKIGNEKIIGATANNFEELTSYPIDSITYFGVGPLRLTKTKEKLKPILGLEGYVSLVSALKEKGISQPIYAIGGIKEADISTLLSIGIHGVALSGLLFDHQHSTEKIKEIVALCATQPINE